MFDYTNTLMKESLSDGLRQAEGLKKDTNHI